MVKPKLFSISGSVHSGKTTISRMLAVEMSNAAYIDGDLIGQWVKMHNLDRGMEANLSDVHEMIIDLLKANLVVGVDVIIDYQFTDQTRQEVIDVLSDIEYEARWFLLKPDIKKALSGSKTRPQLNDWEIERIKYHYKSPLMETELAIVIDSTDQTPVETLSEVLNKIGGAK